jgi:hypothetical protein
LADGHRGGHLEWVNPLSSALHHMENSYKDVANLSGDGSVDDTKNIIVDIPCLILSGSKIFFFLYVIQETHFLTHDI